MADLENLAAYDFALPEELIAQRPIEPRDASRLLVIDRARGSWEHRIFRDLPEYLVQGDVLVANNSKVIRARLLGRRLTEDQGRWVQGGKVEFLLLERRDHLVWEGAFHAAAKHKPGVMFEIPTPDGRGLRGKLVSGASQSQHGTVLAEFDRDPVDCGAGTVPLPPYISRAAVREDEDSYQTLYAKHDGSAAAPTAGFHFSDELFARLREKGVQWEEVTLHVGLGTFRPVKAGKVSEHVMHEERFDISSETKTKILEAKSSGRRVIGVGTTAVRTLEGAWRSGEGLVAGSGRTSIFLRPGHADFHVVNGLITNFHLPKSTLLMLVCAFAGRDLIIAAYEEAVRLKYRFFSYGDAMLIL